MCICVSNWHDMPRCVLLRIAVASMRLGKRWMSGVYCLLGFIPPVAGEPNPCVTIVSQPVLIVADFDRNTERSSNYQQGERVTYVEGSALTVQRPDNIRSANRLALAHLDYGADIPKDLCEEGLQDESDLLVDRS